MIWWELVDSLTTQLATSAPKAVITIGAAGDVPRVATIRVRPDADTNPDSVMTAPYRGQCSLRLECWTQDAADPSVAYQALAELNDACLQGLREWRPTGITVVDITAVVTFDEDLFRPSVGNLLTLTVQWQRTDLFA